MTARPNLIVIDDENDMADIVCDAAGAQGFDAEWIGDPTEFLARPTSEADLIVLDLFMPGVDGIELLRFLAERRIDASLILMTGKDPQILNSARQMAGELGLTVLGTLNKPFSLVELRETLSRYNGKAVKKAIELPSAAELEKAIADGQLRVVYQPLVKMADRSVFGFEALARWTHTDKGPVPPDYFIPLAERHGLISAISELVETVTIRQCGEWRSAGLDYRLSINISPKILVDLRLPDILEKMATDNRVTTEDILLEVTETAVKEDIAKYIGILTRLRMKGFTLAIDDFGTGQSSLQQLTKVPFSELKIDKAFVKSMDSDRDCRMIVETSVRLAHSLDMHVIAEGIETEDIWNKLRDLGCNIGQGYWIGKPMPADELNSWAAGWSAR